MGAWLVQLFNEEDLAKLDEKQIDHLKGHIRKELARNPEIIRQLRTKLEPVYRRFVGEDPGPQPPP